MVVCMHCSLFQPVHTLFDPDVNLVVVGDKGINVIALTDVCWKVFIFDSHELGIVHWGHQKKVFQVGTQEFGILFCIRDDAIDDELSEMTLLMMGLVSRSDTAGEPTSLL
jgi:hypothetical protein